MAAEPRPSRALRQTENQASNDLANDWTTGGLGVPGPPWPWPGRSHTRGPSVHDPPFHPQPHLWSYSEDQGHPCHHCFKAVGTYLSHQVDLPPSWWPSPLIPPVCSSLHMWTPHWGLKTGFLAFPVLSKETPVSQLSLPHKVGFGDIRLHLRSEVPQPLKTHVWMEPAAFPEPISHNPTLCHQQACPQGGAT